MSSPEQRMRDLGGKTIQFPPKSSNGHAKNGKLRERHGYKQEEAPRSGRLRVLSVDDLIDAPPRDYIIKGWLSPAEISLTVGAKNARKSFLMLHVAYAISQGRSVFERRVKQTPVLYVVCEGEKGIGKRVKALARRYSKSTAFHVIAQPVDLLHCKADADDLQELIKAVQTHHVGWVIVDTVSRVMPGGEENTSGDMGLLLHNLNVLRHQTGAHVTGIHHGTQDDGTKSRGHSSLPNGADAILQVEWNGDDKGFGTATLGFARDDKTGLVGTFRAEEVILGEDEDGDDVTTLLINELDAAENMLPTKKERRRMTDDQEHMWTIVQNAMAQAGPVRPLPDMPIVTGMLRTSVRERLIRDGWFDEGELYGAFPDRKPIKKALTKENNNLKSLKNRGLLCFTNDFVWLT